MTLQEAHNRHQLQSETWQWFRKNSLTPKALWKNSDLPWLITLPPLFVPIAMLLALLDKSEGAMARWIISSDNPKGLAAFAVMLPKCTPQIIEITPIAMILTFFGCLGLAVLLITQSYTSILNAALKMVENPEDITASKYGWQIIYQSKTFFLPSKLGKLLQKKSLIKLPSTEKSSHSDAN
jgi:hypothetical protein